MDSRPSSVGSWRPPRKVAHSVGFALLLLTTASLLSNAYYFQFLEPAVSRKLLAGLLVAATALWFALLHFGLPRDRDERRSAWLRLRTPAALAAILLVAFGLRYQGIRSGLPQSYIPDEYDYVHSYLQMIKRGDMNPRWWHHPSVQPYVNVVAYLVAFYLDAPTGRWRSVQQIQVEDALLWGRFAAGVVPGVLGVLFVFFLGRRVFDERVGLVAAAILATAPGVVEASQYNKPDALLTLFCTVSVLTSLIYLERGGRALALGAGIAIGLTVATKYNGALVLIPFLAAVLYRQGFRTPLRADLYLGALGAVVGFTAGCPYWYADLQRFLDHVAAGLYSYGYMGLEGAEGVDNWYTHASYTVRYGAGLLPFLASLTGLAIALFRIDRRIFVFLLFPVLYYSFYSSQKVIFPGNLVPVYPFFAVLAGLGIVGIVERTASLLESRARLPRPWLERLALALVLVAVLWFPVRVSRLHNRLAMLPDTGNLAADWIEANFPARTVFALERQTPAIDAERFRIVRESRVINQSLDHLREAGVQYLIVSSTVYNRFGPEHRQSQRYQRLFEACPLVKEFRPERGRIGGPTIRILRVPEA